MKLKNWYFSCGSHHRLSCTVPCSLYSILLDNGLMDDPFYRLNDQEATALSDQDCTFETTFAADSGLMEKDFVKLVFHGLDTLCDVYLNEALLTQTDNMHRTYTIDAKPLIRAGENHLRIDIHSPVAYIREMQRKHKLWNADVSLDGTGHIRKAACMYGWDWGPALPDMGLFREIELISYNTAKLESVLIRQQHGENQVILTCDLEISGNTDDTSCLLTVDGKSVPFSGSHCRAAIDHPKLWWPNGYGGQPLYELRFDLLQHGKTIDTLSQTIGLRTLSVSAAKDRYGEEFCFMVNGVKIFAMGADYIPQDSLYARVDHAKTDQLLQDCVDANFNCLRVWGGGYYPPDEFYDLCDRYGLIIWQDFMFACVNIRMRQAFEETVAAEAICNLKRIRNHACLGLLCGNNEMEEGVSSWGIGVSELVRADYLRLYENLLPELCARYAPETFYWPSSPSSGGGFDNPTDHCRGDLHFWDVYLYGKPVDHYRTIKPRFCSEFGFSAFPSLKTVKAFADKEDFNPYSPVMEGHQKYQDGNIKILSYCASDYLLSGDFETIIYASQLKQAQAISVAVEHFRRHRGQCMGAIYWQLNDCWPVISWSSIDYYGRWKALHYAAKRFFAPVLLSLHPDQGETTFTVSNETLSRFAGTLRYTIKDTSLQVIAQAEAEVNIPRLSSQDILTLDLTADLTEHRDRFLEAQLCGPDGSLVSTQTMLPVPPKQFAFQKPDIHVSAATEGDRLVFSVTCDTFAQGVCLDFADADIKLSDNYFDITSAAPVKLYADPVMTPEAALAQLKVKSVYDIR